MEIRRATIEDVPDIYSCCVASFREYILLIGRTPGPMLEDYYEGVRRHHTFVIPYGDAIAGFALVKDGVGDFMWLDVLAVFPSFSNRGAGQALIAHCENFIQRAGKSECRLYTHVKYTKAQAIYLRRGYEIYDRILEDGFDRYYMRKRLCKHSNSEAALS